MFVYLSLLQSFKDCYYFTGGLHPRLWSYAPSGLALKATKPNS